MQIIQKSRCNIPKGKGAICEERALFIEEPGSDIALKRLLGCPQGSLPGRLEG